MSVPNSLKHLYIVGNGPSLKTFDFDSLRGEKWIGMNAAYRHWRKIDLYPTYYCCLDREVGLSHVSEIEKMVLSADALGIEQFFLDDAVVKSNAVLSGSEKVLSASELFAGDQELTSRITTGSHSVLWAAHLGFSEFTLLGIDLNYEENVEGLQDKGEHKLEVVEENESPNYYFPDYQQVGDRLNRPNPVENVHQLSWRRVMRRLSTDFPHIRVTNASPHSSIPGLSLSDTGSEATTPNSVADVHLRKSVSVVRWIEAALPSRFNQIDDPKKELLSGFGAAWKSVNPEDAANKGRWHIQVLSTYPLNYQAPLGSFVWLKSVSDCSSEEFTAQFSLFDQVIRIWTGEIASPQLTAILALRLDTVTNAALNTASIGRKFTELQKRATRLIWRFIRLFDMFRSDRA